MTEMCPDSGHRARTEDGTRRVGHVERGRKLLPPLMFGPPTARAGAEFPMGRSGGMPQAETLGWLNLLAIPRGSLAVGGDQPPKAGSPGPFPRQV